MTNSGRILSTVKFMIHGHIDEWNIGHFSDSKRMYGLCFRVVILNSSHDCSRNMWMMANENFY